METVGFVPEPNCGRGTVGIIWTCLTTIFLSTWTSMHMHDYQPPTIYMVMKVTIWGVYFFIPELAALGAIRLLFSAWTTRRALRLIPGSGWERCTLRQAFLFGVLERFVSIAGQAEESLSMEEFTRLARSGKIRYSQLPDDDQIKARSKSDSLSKGIAIVQMLWFAASIVARLVAKHPISLLEDVTVAYVFCGLAIFIAYYRCPQNVQEPFVLRGQDTDTRNTDGEQVGDHVSSNLEPSEAVVVPIAILITAIYTGIYLAAWNYPFASTTEAWLWRLLSIAGGILVVTWISLSKLTKDEIDLVFLAVLGLARLGIIVLALMAFRQAPAGIYQKPSWVAYWGHIGG
ncbi:hypothetical protein QBC46DRAFT_389453 [Diplogelasinospora grovesii]|uniref:Uncharacterized protein n=1 Tax=Diplogelasinospora grovesii TaxID=303347 RepID=A0AAN6S3N1_9PEZI|nr:hypothetical protein QBC46DRAFT_389453 [Diplogelasinospora grovesii]